jgi:hypothetical protein
VPPTARERVIAGQVGLGPGAIIASPFQFATEGTDMLRFRIWGVNRRPALGSLAFTGTVRGVRADGSQQVTTRTFIVTTSPFPVQEFVTLEAGFLQTVSVTYSGNVTDTIHGPVYCVVDLVRGTPAGAQIVVGQLLGGSTGPGQALSWPGAPIVGPLDGRGYQYVSDNVGGLGAEVTIAVPQLFVWRVRAIFAFFAAAAGGVNRQPQIVFRTSGVGVAVLPSGGPVAPATNQSNTWIPGAPFSLLASVAAGTSPLPDGLILRFGDDILTSTASLAAGDQYQAFRVQVEEWIEPLL